jgi:predicted HTH domain antitoxin
MHTLTDVELQRDPGRLLDTARRDQVTLITLDGQSVLLTVPLEQGAPAPGAMLDLAVALYERGSISLGRAAEIAGWAYPDMMDELNRRDIATLQLHPGDLDRELAAFKP